MESVAPVASGAGTGGAGQEAGAGSAAAARGKRLDGRHALTCAVIAAAALTALAAVMPKEGAPRGDDLIYEEVARHPFAPHTFPFGLRFGLPLLVHLLPLPGGTGFLVLAILAAAAAAAVAFLLMRELGAGARVAGPLAVAMCLSPPFLVVILRHGRNTDIATVLLMLLATHLAVRRRYWQLAIALLVGVAVREAVLFVVPFAYALWAYRPVDRDAALRVLAVATPALGAYLAIRLSVPTVGKASVPGYAGPLLEQRLRVFELGLSTPAREARRAISVYGPLWLVAPLALGGMAFARRGLVLVALCVVAMTYALDWGRMLLLAAPVFYPAAAWVLERRPRLRLPTMAAFALLIVVYAVYMAHSGVRTGILEAGPPPYPIR
ncbi:MAG TPA: hypothetical protein VN618_06930 [Solirubrobacteraceae bacterium]|nr:hypothetical protein [Solirubrobacteraceae bacterium]